MKISTLTKPSESPKGLWYNPTINRFEDATGAIMHDLSLYFPTWQLDVWKKGQRYQILKDRQGFKWFVHYDSCTHMCHKCESRCEIYEMIRDW